MRANHSSARLSTRQFVTQALFPPAHVAAQPGEQAEQQRSEGDETGKIGVHAARLASPPGAGHRHAVRWRAAQVPTQAMRSMLVAPGVPKGMPAVMTMGSPAAAKPWVSAISTA